MGIAVFILSFSFWLAVASMLATDEAMVKREVVGYRGFWGGYGLRFNLIAGIYNLQVG
jgi:hypothetical protein